MAELTKALCKVFLSTPSARRATPQRRRPSLSRAFLSTPSARRATAAALAAVAGFSNFYPRPPRGGRPERSGCGLIYHRFLSTPSARRATSRLSRARHLQAISIHALREEGDPREREQHHRRDISIHALREEGDQVPARHRVGSARFLSTPSARRATPRRAPASCCRHDFYPRPPRGGRPPLRLEINTRPPNFYPRPPRGGRPSLALNALPFSEFLSTPSARRATCDGCYNNGNGLFLSTPSARRATAGPCPRPAPL